MLTKDLSIVEFDGSKRIPDRLTRRTHAGYAERAERAIAVYTKGTGKRRQELHQEVDVLFDDDEHYIPRRVQALCRLLDQGSKWNEDKDGISLKLRTEIFTLAGMQFPLVTKPGYLFGSARSEVVQSIAKHLARPWEEIEEALFDDVKQFQRLRRFDGFSSALDLLARYNVAQVQTCLYEAVNMTINAGTDFKEILRFAKLAGLMHTITRCSDGRYLFYLDGPASLMSNVQQYGHRMARMIPGLLSCSDWQLVAQFNKKGWRSTFSLSDKEGLRSPVESADEFDSSIEADFAEKWGEAVREGWSLSRESEVLHHGQKVFVPDFLLKHSDGRVVHLEIVAYWTPEYLKAKRDTLDEFSSHHVLIAISESLSSKLGDVGFSVVTFAKKLAPAAVLRGLDKINFPTARALSP